MSTCKHGFHRSWSSGSSLSLSINVNLNNYLSADSHSLVFPVDLISGISTEEGSKLESLKVTTYVSIAEMYTAFILESFYYNFQALFVGNYDVT